MTDSTDKVPSRDAVARRRQMHRRHATRRVKNVIVTTAVVFTLAVLAPPEASTSTVAPASAGIEMLPSPTAGPGTSTLPIQPLWRRPGDVLKRSKAVTAVKALPFGLDPKDRERRESLGRWHRIYTYSATYRIKPELARRIYDAAMTAGIEPELGFRLIRVESVFDTRAVSSAGALGLTQLMLGTAREYEPRVTREQLLDPDVNLRIGFKYLRGLVKRPAATSDKPTKDSTP